MSSELKKKLLYLKSIDFFSTLEIQRGIEKESLRVDKDGAISEKTHPIGLGSSLTNPYITTDFAEALIEFVTPVFSDINELYEFLLSLHSYTVKNLKDGELLWAFSMPPKISDESSIRIAEYGTSNIGKLKNIYRKGLEVRYGATMQCVAGIHYNFSISEQSMVKLINSNKQDDIDSAYLSLIRNFKRVYWFILSEFGDSSIADGSFVKNRNHNLDINKFGDVFSEGATSLRMSEIGYQSEAQKNLNIKYNSLDEFLIKIKEAILAPYKKFYDLKLRDKNMEFQQISSGILQIENEFYDSIRPKRSGESGQRPYELLKEKGIGYVEVRGIDLSSESIIGISKDQIRILDLVLLHCLLLPSPLISNEEMQKIKESDEKIINSGRLQNIKTFYKGKNIELSSAREDYINELSIIANNLDEKYIQAVAKLSINKFNLKIRTSFHDHALKKSKEHFNELKKISNINDDIKIKVNESLKKFDKINNSNEISIDKFIETYNSKL